MKSKNCYIILLLIIIHIWTLGFMAFSNTTPDIIHYGPNGINLSINSGKEFYKQSKMKLISKSRELFDEKNAFIIQSRSIDNFCFRAVDCEILPNMEYTIEANIEQISASSGMNDPNGYGLLFGAKNENNYSAFLLNGVGYFEIFNVIDGKKYTIASIRASKAIKQGCSRNHLRIDRVNSSFLFYINGELVYRSTLYNLQGKYQGFFVCGKGSYGLNSLYITGREIIAIERSKKTTPASSIQSQKIDHPRSKESPALKQIGSGTGFFIDSRGYLATNDHVIRNASKIIVCINTSGTWRSYNATIIKEDTINDLAIIKINDSSFTPYSEIPYCINNGSENIASEVFTLGYPQVQVMGVDIKYSVGVISSKSGILDDPTHYQISAHIDHGNSGGPLFNSKGDIIGITDSGLSKAAFGDVNYAIKSMYLNALIASLPTHIQTPSINTISNSKRENQIKVLQKYVALILVEL